MKDSKGNKFNVGDTLVSSECPDSGSGILCKSTAGGIALFQHILDDYFQTLPFCLTQRSLDTSKWIKKGG